ncbi:hypothetical protein GL263_21375 [Streptomyces durbertensis]|uniref:Uncharacterized protein n=1 Tax=Streptomyces durbertensis TaxID=2448886 RepID=A0ABR6EL81_9ACTN|nr:hypothetical protein [Streptomyces durbertensis]MBB1246084.1 hypothetical protein [Streptomyces durbertensis]
MAAALVATAAATVAAVMVVRPTGIGERNGVAPTATVAPQADDLLPSVTSTDWVSYADQVVVVRPTSEQEVPASAEERTAGEGYVGRRAVMTVGEVLWSRSGAPAVPRSLTLDVAGWVSRGGERREFAVRGTSRLEIGHTYIVAVARLGDGTWSTLGSGASLPYDGGVIGNGELEGTTVEARPKRSGDGVRERMAGRSAQELTVLLRRTVPDPAAARHADLPPEERHARARAES